MNIKDVLSKIGLGALGVGATAANVVTGGVTVPLTSSLLNAIAAKIDPSIKNQFDLAVASARADMDKAEMDHNAALITAVNATMQAEAKSDSWLQKSWRPLFGLGTLAVIINNYMLLPYFARLGLQPVAVPGEVWNVMLCVLGVAAMTRGVEKITGAYRNGGPAGNGNSMVGGDNAKTP